MKHSLLNIACYISIVSDGKFQQITSYPHMIYKVFRILPCLLTSYPQYPLFLNYEFKFR